MTNSSNKRIALTTLRSSVLLAVAGLSLAACAEGPGVPVLFYTPIEDAPPPPYYAYPAYGAPASVFFHRGWGPSRFNTERNIAAPPVAVHTSRAATIAAPTTHTRTHS